MRYASIDQTRTTSQNGLYTNIRPIYQGAELFYAPPKRPLEDRIWAQLIEVGLESGLASREETQHCNQILGMTHAL